jgi:hypothetical protein
LQGAVEIDLKKQTLEVSVSSSEKHKSADTMSGGERSYFTVSLIMALWDAIDSPFYFMDEFDVFMVRAAKSTVQSGLGLNKSYSSCFLLPIN